MREEWERRNGWVVESSRGYVPAGRQTGVYMPRYFIDVRSRFGCDEDLEGVYL